MQHHIKVIIAAIESKKTLKLAYEPGMRTIEPHAVGYGSKGQVLLRAFQTDGASASGEHINWKLFRLDRIRVIDSDGGTFIGPRSGFKKGDRAMSGGLIAEL